MRVILAQAQIRPWWLVIHVLVVGLFVPIALDAFIVIFSLSLSRWPIVHLKSESAMVAQILANLRPDELGSFEL